MPSFRTLPLQHSYLPLLVQVLSTAATSTLAKRAPRSLEVALEADGGLLLDLACEAAGLLITPLTTGTTARCSRPKPPGPTTKLPVSRGCLVFWGARCGFTLSFPSLGRLDRFIRSSQQPHIYADHSSLHTCSLLLLNGSHTSPSLASRVCASGCCGVVGGVVGGVMEGN